MVTWMNVNGSWSCRMYGRLHRSIGAPYLIQGHLPAYMMTDWERKFEKDLKKKKKKLACFIMYEWMWPLSLSLCMPSPSFMSVPDSIPNHRMLRFSETLYLFPLGHPVSNLAGRLIAPWAFLHCCNPAPPTEIEGIEEGRAEDRRVGGT